MSRRKEMGWIDSCLMMTRYRQVRWGTWVEEALDKVDFSNPW
jgi:hypothetical protein